jgi:hypothetical protein
LPQGYGSGVAHIDRFWNVAVPAFVLYTEVKVVVPGVKPLRTKDAVAFWKALPKRFNAVESLPVAVFAPLMANDMYPAPPPVLVSMPAVTETSTIPDAGTVTVTAGPGVASPA